MGTGEPKVQSVFSHWGPRRVGEDARCSLPKWRPSHACHLPTPQVQSCQVYLRESLLNLAEITDGPLLFASQGGLLQPSVSIIRSEGNRRGRPRRNASADRSVKGANRLKDSSTTSDETSKSSSQEKIIALFKRIQTSISKGGSALSKRRSPNNPKEKQTDKVPSQYDTLSSGDETTEDAVTSGKFKMSRPVSNFAKRSPIPPPSLELESIQKVSEERLPVVAAGEKVELQKLDEMKLPELKELARKRGVKGYSKLKKGELLELLKGLLQSS
ncbi:SAP-like protein BP-73 isoform X4 [Phoenix dactylifera]|uniref:SAP-like protein BP-73 isoform X4 n=1 Tax=Phoenix dactylifera TaxID=42345 RepID=A0A8B7BQX1_PHODC|nr:SAP-like protein BP-73 isoform X4 [Phoenix dactylifera]